MYEIREMVGEKREGRRESERGGKREWGREREGKKRSGKERGREREREQRERHCIGVMTFYFESTLFSSNLRSHAVETPCVVQTSLSPEMITSTCELTLILLRLSFDLCMKGGREGGRERERGGGGGGVEGGREGERERERRRRRRRRRRSGGREGGRERERERERDGEKERREEGRERNYNFTVFRSHFDYHGCLLHKYTHNNIILLINDILHVHRHGRTQTGYTDVVAGSTGVDTIRTVLTIQNSNSDAAIGAGLTISMPTQFMFSQGSSNSGVSKL